MTESYRNQVQFPNLSEEESSSSSSSSSGAGPRVVLDVLSSPSSDYLIQSFLGEGVFGRVAKCVKTATRETVAVKIIKKRHFTPQVQNEVAVLQQLRAFDSDRFNFVKTGDVFVDRDHVCLEFELLDVSLMEFVARKPSRSLSVKEIRPILHQIATTLQLLSSLGAVHADLKTDNIMMVDCKDQPLKVKVIDFGLAHHVSRGWGSSYIQPRFYRSPEVILGLPYTAAIDMWSLGCIAAELFLGHLLYPGNSEYDMLQHMVQTQGQLPQHLLNKGPRTSCFFQKEKRRRRRWRLKTPHEYGNSYFPESYFTSLDDLKKIRPECHLSDEDTVAEIEDLESFVDLLKRMLHLDASKRITPCQLLEDPFITTRDVADSFPDSFYVKSCFELMEVCQDRRLDSDMRDRPPWLNLQASTSKTAKTAKMDRHVSCSVPPAWHDRREHPLVLEIASAVSSCLSIHEDQSPPEREEVGVSGHEEELPLSVASEQPRPSAVKRARKMLKDSFETSRSSDVSPASVVSAKKRMKIDFFKTSREIVQSSSEVSSEAQTTRPQRKKTTAAFTATHTVSKSPDSKSLVRKKRKRNTSEVQTPEELPKKSEEAPAEATSTAAEVKPRRKRTRADFEAAHNIIRSPNSKSPERKKRKKNPEVPAFKELSQKSKEAQKPRRKRTWAAFVASHGEMRASDSGSPEAKKRKRL